MTIHRQSIYLRDFELSVSIGIHETERRAPQRVRFNLTAELAVSEADAGDDIANVLDYDQIRERIVAVARSRHFNLQETLCRAIAAALSDMPGIVRLTVSSEKPDVYPDCAGVGYTLECTFADG